MLKTYHIQDAKIELGVDEAGRGPLWGPMMAAAVYWPTESLWTDSHREIVPSIKDSKKISEKKRKKIAEKIQELAYGYGIGVVSAQEIDCLGATRANQLAFRRALDALYENASDKLYEKVKEFTRVNKNSDIRILIDGILPLNVYYPNEECITIVDGDATYLSIAAASIVAKVAHDTWVQEWCKDHIADAAKYDLLNCKGYGTAKHRQGILDHGYTDLHRRLYLRKLIPDIVVSRYKIVDVDMDMDDDMNEN
jgi:ribonuclease HII